MFASPRILLSLVFPLLVAACDDASGACAQWLADDPDHASRILADLQGGTAEVDGDRLTLRHSGSLSAFTHAEDARNPMSTAALLTRIVPEGDFELEFSLNAVMASSVDLAGFVTVQGDGGGKRFLFVNPEETDMAVVNREWDPYGRYRFEDEDPSGGSNEPVRFSIRREGSTLSYESFSGDQEGGSGNYSPVSGELVLGFGIQNRSLAGVAVDGDIVVSLSSVSLTTSDPDCDAEGFDE